MNKKPAGYWTDETICSHLNIIINKIGRFPTQREIGKFDGHGIIGAICTHGGLNKFADILGYTPNRKPDGYWTEKTVSNELELIIKKLGYFPNQKELYKMERSDLNNAIRLNGGINYFKKLLGYDILRRPKPRGYWSIDRIINELKTIISEIMYFPSCRDLQVMNRYDLLSQIDKRGGINEFRKLLNYPVSYYEEFLSDLSSYNTKRGRNTEKIVKEILKKYCNTHNLPKPEYNVKLSRNRVIEFVCNTDKRIGIDVTNTKAKNVVSRKWRKKEYQKYLGERGELWVIIFSNIFTENDYLRWNNQSPSNVKVMSIYGFINELDYSTDEYTKSKIDKYCSCTFHTKEEFRNISNNNTKCIHKIYLNTITI